MKSTIRIALLVLGVFIAGAIVGGAALAKPASDYETARKYYHSGKYKEAVKYLRLYIDQKPDPAAYYMMGYSLYELKKFDEANEYFREAYLIDPTFTPVTPAAAEELRKPVKKPASPVSQQPEQPDMGPAAGQPEARAAVKAPVPSMAEPQKPGTPAAVPQKGPAAPQTQPAAPGAVAPQKPSPAPSTVTPQQPAPAMPKPPVPMAPIPMPKQALPPGELVGIPMMLGGLFAGFALVFLGISLAVYLFFSYCLYRIAVKLDCPAAWTAWVPILNLWPQVGSAGKPWWWILLLFVPLVGFFIWVYLWMCIVENLGRNKWLGLLMLVPLVNMIYMAVLAFSRDAAPQVAAATTELE